MLNRHLLADADSVRSGGWYRTNGTPPRRLAGQRLGLVGLGNIGRQVAAKARGFGVDVVAYDPYLNAQQPGCIASRSWDWTSCWRAATT